MFMADFSGICQIPSGGKTGFAWCASSGARQISGRFPSWNDTESKGVTCFCFWHGKQTCRNVFFYLDKIWKDVSFEELAVFSENTVAIYSSL